MYGLNGFLRLDNLTAPVIAATGTSVMQKLRSATVGALRYLRLLQSTVIPGAALPCSSLGVFSFWIRHDFLCSPANVSA